MNSGTNASINIQRGAATIFNDDFEGPASNWTLSGEFEINAPAGLGGSYGYADPDSAYSGFHVLGVDLMGTGNYPGDYEKNLGDREYQAISPVINCTGYSHVSMSFQRWLNVENDSWDNAYIDISNDNGASWHNIWQNDWPSISENSWSLQTMDISPYADNQAAVKIRFCIGTTDGFDQYSGWNIDEFQMTGIGPKTADFFKLEIFNSNTTIFPASEVTIDSNLLIQPNGQIMVGAGKNVTIGDK